MKAHTLFFRIIPYILIAFLLCLNIHSAAAQGGPPMITDDSDTPGDGKWENNFGFIFEGSKNDYRKIFPAIDINHGIGEHIQVKAELTWIAEKGDNLSNKFDNITLGFKYRFLDEKKDGVSLSAPHGTLGDFAKDYIA